VKKEQSTTSWFVEAEARHEQSAEQSTLRQAAETSPFARLFTSRPEHLILLPAGILGVRFDDSSTGYSGLKWGYECSKSCPKSRVEFVTCG
jgi:hypothetical protein